MPAARGLEIFCMQEDLKTCRTCPASRHHGGFREQPNPLPNPLECDKQLFNII